MIDARTVLALYLAQLNHYFEAKEAIDPIIDLAEKLGYKRRLCQIHSALASSQEVVKAAHIRRPLIRPRRESPVWRSYL